jgi:membrane-associated phospholipid phosphatase
MIRRNSWTDSHRVARVLTDTLDPKNWMIGTIIYLGWNSDRLTGIWWSIYVIFFTAVLPGLIIVYGINRGWWADRHIGVRRERLAALIYILAPVTIGVLLMTILHAPYKMTGYSVAMLLSAIVLTIITIFWKISIHSTVSSAAVGIMTLACSHYAIFGYVLVALVAWARVALRDHTPAQVLAGNALGTVIAALAYTAIRLTPDFVQGTGNAPAMFLGLL